MVEDKSRRTGDTADKLSRREGSFNRREQPRGEIAIGKIALLGGVFLICLFAAIFLFWH